MKESSYVMATLGSSAFAFLNQKYCSFLQPKFMDSTVI
jgi:hypothetical protein